MSPDLSVKAPELAPPQKKQTAKLFTINPGTFIHKVNRVRLDVSVGHKLKTIKQNEKQNWNKIS